MTKIKTKKKTVRKTTKIKTSLTLPKVLRTSILSQKTKNKSLPVRDVGEFPIDQISASSMRKFSTNPILFKINYVNKVYFETVSNISGVLGKAFHYAMEVYSGGSDTLVPVNEAEAIEYGLKAGLDYLEKYNDGFINFSKTIPNKQKVFDLLTFCFTSYVKEIPYEQGEVVAVEDKILEQIDVEWRGKRVKLPVKLKGYLDKVLRKDGKLKVKDYKTVYNFSKPDKIDGAKILAAVEYYLLAYAKYGEEPYSLTFEEVRYAKNADGSPQVRSYEVVYAENPLYFDFYFRFYEDMIRALNGEMVYVPNVDTIFDNEISILAYIHRLDIPEEQAKLMKKHNVDNISDLLKKEIQSAGNMRKLMKTVEESFVEAKNIDYTKMKNEEKIVTKLIEHGMVLKFDSVLEGSTVDLYQFIPSMGLKMKRLKSYVEDIEQVLGISGVRVLAPIPNSTLVGFEVPRRERTFPTVPAGSGWDIAIGQDIMGAPRRYDIRNAPHILVAGSSGSGKSVWLNGFIEQIARIPKIELHLFDPKRVELSQHKSKAVEYKADIMDIHTGLLKLVDEMTKRYKKLETAGVRNIEGMPDMPYKWIIIDEFGELITSKYVDVQTEKTGHIFSRGSKAGMEEVKTIETNISAEIESNILRIAQMGRAAGIHITIATQTPRTDIIKGTIKANFPTKVVFKTAKAVDSIVILDDMGAEKLAGKGDMLFIGDNGIERLQGYLA